MHKMRHPFKITFLGQNVTVSVTITNQLTQVKDTHIPFKWRQGGIGEAQTHCEAITFGAPSPVAIAPFVEQVLIPFPAAPDGE